MLPEPTMAAFTQSPLFELQVDRTKSGELGVELVAGTCVDGARAGTRQHDVARQQPDTERRDLPGEPRHRDRRVAQHRVPAALGDHLAVAAQRGRDGTDVYFGRPN